MNDYIELKTSISFERFVAAAHLSTANISMHANLETKGYFARLFAVRFRWPGCYMWDPARFKEAFYVLWGSARYIEEVHWGSGSLVFR